MAILFQAANKRYIAKTHTVNFNVNVASELLLITFTHESWPNGDCVNLLITWDDGSSGNFTCGGGQLINKDGSPLVGTVATTWTLQKRPGKVSGILVAEVLQTLYTAIIIESL